jgi:hypothetical protein
MDLPTSHVSRFKSCQDHSTPGSLWQKEGQEASDPIVPGLLPQSGLAGRSVGQGFEHGWDYLSCIADDSHVGHLNNGRLFVGVDCHDELGLL